MSSKSDTLVGRMKRLLCLDTCTNRPKLDGILLKPDPSVVDRMKHLLRTGTGADCHFLVGKENGKKELLSAHKLILISASDVFEAMFRFDAQNAKKSKKASSLAANSSPVEVIDIESEAFKTMLSFIYADDLSGLNGKNVVAVLYAANKYNISGLTKTCIDFPIPKLHNIFLAFSQARNIGQEDFARRCLENIEQNVILLQSEQFLQIDQHLLCEILGRDQLKIDGEIAAWNAALRWADAQCRQNGIKCSAVNRRAVLGAALAKIRFPLIPQGDFTKHIAPLGVLTDQEVISVYMSYHSAAPASAANSALPALYPLPFSTEHRAPVSKSVAEESAMAAWNSNKIKGNIELKFKKVSKWQWYHRYNDQSSSTLHMAGYKWQLSASSKIEYGTGKGSYLSVRLECRSAKKGAAPRIVKCSLTLRIVSQRKGTKDHCETSSCVFSNSDRLHFWNFKDFLTFEYLMDPQNGFYRNDTVLLRVEIVVDKPPAAGGAVE